MKVKTPTQLIANERIIILLSFIFLFYNKSIAQESFCREIAISYSLPSDPIEKEAYKKVVRDLTFIFSTLCSDCCSYISLVEVNEAVGRAEKTLEMVSEEGNTPVRIALREPKNLLSIQKTGFGAGHYQFFLKFEQLKKVPDKEKTYILGETRETSLIHFSEDELLSRKDITRKKEIGERLYSEIGINSKKLNDFLVKNDKEEKQTTVIDRPSEIFKYKLIYLKFIYGNWIEKDGLIGRLSEVIPIDLAAELSISPHIINLVTKEKQHIVLNEIAYQYENWGIYDHNTIAEMSKQSGANALLIGKITDAGDRKIMVAARIVMMDTGETKVEEYIIKPRHRFQKTVPYVKTIRALAKKICKNIESQKI
ncbi:MAG: hypothetical protein H6557_02470 [Lewinellaceae bacterium]|nr:hypothetical protein [Phaeodactylibacter sp.]MCB9035463.1 hypothetical protein [Lewinellaceae bacterium]